MADLKKQKEGPHDVLKRIKYKSHTKDVRYINPGEEQVDFAHLSDADYQLLLKMNVIRPATAAAKGGKS